MKPIKSLTIPFLACLTLASIAVGLVCVPSAMAVDMRKSYADLEQKRKEIAAKAEKELTAARAEAHKEALAIKKDKNALVSAIAALKAKNNRLQTANDGLKEKIDILADQQAELQSTLEESRMVNKELAGFVRTYAKDLNSILAQSPQSAFDKDRNTFLEPVINQERFWSMDDLRQMSDILFKEILASGEVSLRQGMVVDRQGKDVTAQILNIGNFTSLYVLNEDADHGAETGFLLFPIKAAVFLPYPSCLPKNYPTRLMPISQDKTSLCPWISPRAVPFAGSPTS